MTASFKEHISVVMTDDSYVVSKGVQSTHNTTHTGVLFSGQNSPRLISFVFHFKKEAAVGWSGSAMDLTHNVSS